MQPDPIRSQTTTRATSYDVGLRSHLQQIYNRMSLGVLVTALTAMVVSSSPALMTLFLGGPQAYIIMFAPLAVLWFGFRPTMPASKLALSFFGISILYGISFSMIAVMAMKDPTMGANVARAFFIAVAMFAGLSVFGYTTKKNLDGLASFAIMGVFGVLFLAIINMFVGSTMIQNLVCGIGIIAFSGITAWQTQNMKESYSPAHGTENNSRQAWFAALNLYIAFIAMFQYILHFLSNR